MPREKSKYAHGKNPNSRKGDGNLIPINKRSKEEQRVIQDLATEGKRAKWAKKLIIREILEECCNKLEKDTETGEELPRLVSGINKLSKHFAKTGDPKELDTISEHMGQKPAQKVEQLVITPEVDFDKLAQLRKALKDE